MVKMFSLAVAVSTLALTGIVLTNVDDADSASSTCHSATTKSCPSCPDGAAVCPQQAATGKPSDCQGGLCPEGQDPNAICPMCGNRKSECHQAMAAGKNAACGLCRESGCSEKCEHSLLTDAAVATTSDGDHPVQSAGRGFGRGRGHGMGAGHSEETDARHEKDHQDFFFLVEHRDEINRTVTNLEKGIETVTESDNPDVAARIKVHVESMYDRIENNNPIRMRDPLFRELFANADRIVMEVEPTEKGVVVREVSEDPKVVRLLQEHAQVVNLFIKNGYQELPKNHAVPEL